MWRVILYAAVRIFDPIIFCYFATRRMKTRYLPIIIALFAFAACEEGPNLAIRTENATKPVDYSIDTAPVIPQSGLQKLTYKVGPFKLSANQKAQIMQDDPGKITFSTDEPMWVTKFTSKITDADGGDLPKDLLYTAIVANSGEKNPLCTDKEVANPFFAANTLNTEIELPEGFGYAVLADEKLETNVVLRNPHSQGFEAVYFEFEITAVPMRMAKNIKDVAPLLLDIDPCDHAPMAIAPKEFVKKRAEFELPEGGRLTKAYGLLQNYGVEVSLTNGKQPTPFWQGKTELDTEHEIVSLKPFEDSSGIPLKSGDSLTMNVIYDNSSTEWKEDATGAVMAYVARSDEAAEKTTAKASTLVESSAVKTQSYLLK